MDKIEKLRDVVKKVLLEYTKPPFADEEIETEVIFDSENDRYMLVEVGWENNVRVHQSNCSPRHNKRKNLDSAR